MHDICDRAALSPGALYDYFPGKQALIEALAVRRAADATGAASDPLGRLAGLASTEAAAGDRLDLRLWAEALDDPAIRASILSVRARDQIGLRDLFDALAFGLAARRGLDPAFDARPMLATLARLLAAAQSPAGA